MKRFRCYNHDDAVLAMQEYVDPIWNKSIKRKWLISSPSDSYEQKQYNIEVRVLEGSPPKQIAILNRNCKQILLLSGASEKEAVFDWEPFNWTDRKPTRKIKGILCELCKTDKAEFLVCLNSWTTGKDCKWRFVCGGENSCDKDTGYYIPLNKKDRMWNESWTWQDQLEAKNWFKNTTGFQERFNQYQSLRYYL